MPSNKKPAKVGILSLSMCDFFNLSTFHVHCFRWTFHLYDLNGDGVITKDEMEDVTASVKLTFEFSPSSSTPSLVTIQTDSIHSKSRIALDIKFFQNSQVTCNVMLKYIWQMVYYSYSSTQCL